MEVDLLVESIDDCTTWHARVLDLSREGMLQPPSNRVHLQAKKNASDDFVRLRELDMTLHSRHHVLDEAAVRRLGVRQRLL